jgi:hypothetical protein
MAPSTIHHIPDTMPRPNNKPTSASVPTATGRLQAGIVGGFQPSVNSVLCGKGKEAFNHVGNRRFRFLTGTFIERYSKTSNNKTAKSAIVSEILNIVHEAGGNFCKFESGAWVEVGEHHSREKVSALLRDLLHTQYRSSAKSKISRRRRNQSTRKIPTATVLPGEGVASLPETPETPETEQHTTEDHNDVYNTGSSADDESEDRREQEDGDDVYDNDNDIDDGNKKPQATTPIVARRQDASNGHGPEVDDPHGRGNSKERPDGVEGDNTDNSRDTDDADDADCTKLDYMIAHNNGHTEFDSTIDYNVCLRKKLTFQLTNIEEYLDSLFEQKKMLNSLADKRAKVEDGQKLLHDFWKTSGITPNVDNNRKRQDGRNGAREDDAVDTTCNDHTEFDSSIDHYVLLVNKLTLQLTNIEEYLCSLFVHKKMTLRLAEKRAKIEASQKHL